MSMNINDYVKVINNNTERTNVTNIRLRQLHNETYIDSQYDGLLIKKASDMLAYYLDFYNFLVPKFEGRRVMIIPAIQQDRLAQFIVNQSSVDNKLNVVYYLPETLRQVHTAKKEIKTYDSYYYIDEELPEYDVALVISDIYIEDIDTITMANSLQLDKPIEYGVLVDDTDFSNLEDRTEIVHAFITANVKKQVDFTTVKEPNFDDIFNHNENPKSKMYFENSTKIGRKTNMYKPFDTMAKYGLFEQKSLNNVLVIAASEDLAPLLIADHLNADFVQPGFLFKDTVINDPIYKNPIELTNPINEHMAIQLSDMHTYDQILIVTDGYVTDGFYDDVKAKLTGFSAKPIKYIDQKVNITVK